MSDDNTLWRLFAALKKIERGVAIYPGDDDKYILLPPSTPNPPDGYLGDLLAAVEGMASEKVAAENRKQIQRDINTLRGGIQGDEEIEAAIQRVAEYAERALNGNRSNEEGKS